MSELSSKSDRTKQFIIERVAPVFNMKGYCGTSLSDLTTATKLTKGSIYGNFRNKNEVALAAFDYNFKHVTKYLKERILAHENSIDRLLVYTNVYRNFLKIPFFKAGCPILNTATEADDTHPELKEKTKKALYFWKISIENQIKRGISRKEIKSDVNPTDIAIIMISLIEGAIMQAKVTGKYTELRTSMNFLENYIMSLKP